MRCTRVLLIVAGLLCFEVFPMAAQDQGSPPSSIPAGTRFLVRLDDPITTEDAKVGNPFRAHTLESVSAPDGEILRMGTEIAGHIDKVEQAHQAGRARIWLTFDEVKTVRGDRPLVAFVSDIPGVHSVRVVFEREGAIEARSSRHQDQAEAAAAGAFVGTAPGVVAHNGKEAALGAAVGALTAFMLSSGLGHELTLDKNTKLELTLDHPLNLN